MIFDDLNDSQSRAVRAVRGPVCILAGAGSGKTTTITRRIANQIATGEFRPDEILAVTFTDRAAAEMRSRLKALGVPGVRARTFHAEALAQVAARIGRAPKLLSSKASILTPLVKRLPVPYKFRPAKDIAAEIEWAKNRRISPSNYELSLDGRTLALPPDLMVRIYGAYEQRKSVAGFIDFEDLLELAIGHVSRTYKAFTVDEFQDVNLLQTTLLDRWLGGGDELCVVGDDYQSIYGFTGASPAPLLGFASRYPAATVICLEHNYRSTPQVLTLANRLVPRLGGAPKNLTAVVPDGPEVVLGPQSDEIAFVVSRIRELIKSGIPPAEIAILYRINARSEDFETALARAGIPFTVRDGVFLKRAGPRAVLRSLERMDGSASSSEVALVAASVGWNPLTVPDGAQEIDRQADLGRLVSMSSSVQTVGEFLALLSAQYSDNDGADGVLLSTYHRVKGCEFEAVFLPRLEERELPFALSLGDDGVVEERRLLYVGITRAKRCLFVSWSLNREGRSVRPSRFLKELVPAPAGPLRREAVSVNGNLFARLRAWRMRTATEAGVPPYVVFHDATLRVISEVEPSSLAQLAGISGIGPTKLARYGADLLAVVAHN